MMPTITSRSKRIVLVHDDGLAQIIGHTDGELPVQLMAEGAAIETRGKTIPFASLVRVTSRAAFYKAPTVPKSYGSFHKAQQ